MARTRAAHAELAIRVGRGSAWGVAGAARDVAGAISRDAGPDEFNETVRRLNDSREVALNLCDASY